MRATICCIVDMIMLTFIVIYKNTRSMLALSVVWQCRTHGVFRSVHRRGFTGEDILLILYIYTHLYTLLH